MPIDPTQQVVTHRIEKRRFEIEIDDLLCTLEYQLNSERKLMTIFHTGVPRPLEGQGLAGRMAKEALDWARQNGLAVVPLCSYIVTYVRRHPEYQDLIRY